MKISVIGSRGYPYVYSGYETFVKELCERLVDKGVSVTVYCHSNLFKTQTKQVNGIDLVYLPTIERKSLSQLIHSFQSMLHACFSDTDVILAVNPANGPFGVISKLFNKKTAINVDGLEWLRPKWKGIGGKYFYWAAKMSTKLYDQVINDSEAMRQVYLTEFNKDSVVIEYGANIRASNNPELIKRWDLKSNGYYLIVGRLIPDNNSDIIIREFVKSKSIKKLVVVGDVPYKDEFADAIKATKDERVIFTGYVNNQDELAELYHHCFLYFHGHEFGGTNPTMLKAMAYGCAIFALDTPFTKEMTLNGKYGHFFTKRDGDLCSQIDNIECNEEAILNLKMISRDRIRDYYNWERITDLYYDLFTGMILNKKNN